MDEDKDARRVMQDSPIDTGEPETQRGKQRAHGAQSDQGAAGQTLDKGGKRPQAYEGPEESNQQRRYESP